VPSRFLLDTIAALAGERLYADDLEQLEAPWFTAVPSFAAGIAHLDFPATDQEYRLRSLLDHCGAGRAADAHELARHDHALRLGVECATARASARFTRFDGNLGALAIPSPAADGAVVSPTRLEKWARSPHDYLMEHLLRVEIPELPEEVYELSPLDRGSLVHETLDEFLREVLARSGGAPTPDTPWSDADRARLRELAEARCAAYEATGLTGQRVFWQHDRRRILADLDRFLSEDDDVRAGQRLRTVATELRFGFRDHGAAVAIALADGRTLHFRGSADRVDRADDGTLWVIDYKTGRAQGLDPDDPTSGGTRLQLPVYAEAARSAFAEPDTPVGAAYWFVSTRGEFRWAELELTAAVRARMDEVLRTITDGIERGVFPCRVDAPDTRPRRWRTYEDPDLRGTRDRHREWERKRTALELAAYVALTEPEPSDREAGIPPSSEAWPERPVSEANKSGIPEPSDAS
jgi:RecB family exonuclease